jgi:tight adherence protein B
MVPLAAFFAAVFAYLAIGYLSGNAPEIRFRSAARPDVPARQLWLIQAGSDLTPAQFWAGSAAIGSVVFAFSLVISGAWWLAVVPTIGAFILPKAYYGRRRLARLDEVRQAWPDAIRDLLASVGAGSTLVNALIIMSKTGPLPIRAAFDRFPVQVRMQGVIPALELLKEEMGDATTDKVVEVLVLAHAHGGDLTEVVLRDLIAEIGEDLRVESEIRTQGLEQRIESRVVVIVPWALLLFLAFLPGAYRDFYRSSSGLFIVIIAALWSLLGMVVLRQFSKRDPERRVLGGSAVVREGTR